MFDRDTVEPGQNGANAARDQGYQIENRKYDKYFLTNKDFRF